MCPLEKAELRQDIPEETHDIIQFAPPLYSFSFEITRQINDSAREVLWA